MRQSYPRTNPRHASQQDRRLIMDIQPLYEEFAMSKYVNTAHRDANILLAIKTLREENQFLRQQLTKPADDTISVSKGEWEAMKKLLDNQGSDINKIVP
jgi:hypothetical protein